MADLREPRGTAAEDEAIAAGGVRSWARGVPGWSWPPGFAIVQFPNLPLALALLAGIAARATEGTAHRSLRAVFYLSLGVWAWEEARHGENWFRRLLGSGFLIYLVVELTSALRR